MSLNGPGVQRTYLVVSAESCVPRVATEHPSLAAALRYASAISDAHSGMHVIVYEATLMRDTATLPFRRTKQRASKARGPGMP